MTKIDNKIKHDIRNHLIRIESIIEILFENPQEIGNLKTIKTDALKSLQALEEFIVKTSPLGSSANK